MIITSHNNNSVYSQKILYYNCKKEFIEGACDLSCLRKSVINSNPISLWEETDYIKVVNTCTSQIKNYSEISLREWPWFIGLLFLIIFSVWLYKKF